VVVADVDADVVAVDVADVVTDEVMVDVAVVSLQLVKAPLSVAETTMFRLLAKAAHALSGLRSTFESLSSQLCVVSRVSSP